MPRTYEPFYWYNSDSKLFTGRDYLGDSPDLIHRARAIAQTAANELGIDDFFERFLENISKGWYSFASPVWTAYGNDRGLPISCFGSFIPDSMEGIMSTLAEVGMMSKHGGGTSAYFGALRGRGSSINSSGGTSFGAVHFMQLFETIIQVVSQSNVRRGQFAAYLPIDHPDVLEFLKLRHHSSKIHDLSFGITVTDQWMEEMIAGDKDKKKIWAAVIQKRVESGYPYIFFTDTINNSAPDAYKDNLRRIWASNLCLVGETSIEISKSNDGNDSMKITLEEFCFLPSKDIWFVKSKNPETLEDNWSEVTARSQTGTSKELFEIETPSGKKIRCTPEHKILTVDRGWVMAKYLDENDTLYEVK